MKRAFHTVIVAALAAPALVLGQAQDVSAVLADLRAALGGDALEAVRSMSISGTNTRATIESKSTMSKRCCAICTWSPRLTIRAVTVPEIGARTSV